MSRISSRKINENIIRENYINPYIKSDSIDNLALQTVSLPQPYTSKLNSEPPLIQSA